MGSAGYAVRAPEQHELDRFRACVEAGFAVRLPAGKREELVASLDPHRTVAAFDGLQLVGTIAGHAVELTLPGPRVVPALALADVTVWPTHRRRGVLTAMMRASLDAAYGRGEHLAVLGSSQGALYGRFGFGPATRCASYAVERAGATLLAPIVTPGDAGVVLLEPHEAAEALPAVFDHARREQPGEIGREAAWWDELLAPPGEADAATRFVAGYEQDGTIDGYAVYEVQRAAGERREVVLDECVTTTGAAYAALFAYLLSIELTDGLRAGTRPVEEPLCHMLADPRALRTLGTRDGTWLRLVDARSALAARRYAAPGRVVLELADPFCPWNAGRVAVEAGRDGVAEVERTSEDPDLAMDAAVLGALYLGGVRTTTMRSAGRVREHVLGAAARFDALLHCDPVPFCTTL